MEAEARLLNDRQREEFVAAFYEAVDFDDTDSPIPWGCPWYHGARVILHGDSIKEMAANWAAECSKDAC